MIMLRNMIMLKRVLSLLLIAIMLVSVFVSCEAEEELTARERKKVKLYEKYEDLIKAIEDEDYDEAREFIDEIFEDYEDGDANNTDEDSENSKNGFFGGEDDTSSDTDRESDDIVADTETPDIGSSIVTEAPETETVPSETEPEEELPAEYLEAAKIAQGSWIYKVNSSIVSVIIHENSIIIEGNEYSWHVESADYDLSEFVIVATSDDKSVYRLEFTKNYYHDIYYNYVKIVSEFDYLYGSERLYYAPGFSSAEFTAYEITTENFYDYFEYVEYYKYDTNVFGDFEEYIFYQEFVTKSDYFNVSGDLSFVNIEFKYNNGYFTIGIDPITYEMTVKEAVEVYENNFGTSSLDRHSVTEQYYLSIDYSEVVNISDPGLYIYYDIEITNASGYIFIRN